MLFTRIEKIELPETAEVGKSFTVVMAVNGEAPFVQLIVRHNGGWEWIVKGQYVTDEGQGRYRFDVPPEAYHDGIAYLQIEGCRVADIHASRPENWIKTFRDLQIVGNPTSQSAQQSAQQSQPKHFPKLSVTLGDSNQPVIYFGIHKHMHQPYYNATDMDYWDGDKDSIFGQRGGPYTHFIAAAVHQYIEGGLAHAGLSTSWSGSLIEQLHRCNETGRGQGAFGNWHHALRDLAGAKTALGNPRVDFSAFGFFHPLMPLIPARDIVGQIEWHRRIIRDTFGVEASDVMFPPETAFQPHMIPALKQAGITAILYDSIHHFRACQDYPYAGSSEGMLPPNPADQINPPVNDWLHLQNIWAPSQISPQLLKPCILYYTDHQGKEHEIIGVPAERYLGNEDARGGYGALQYEGVMGQIHEQLHQTNSYDPKHPPFFVLHSDGDNYGGGADSYYTCNTAGLVKMCQTDSRFQLTTIKDYLQRFPVDPKNRVHVEAGSWAGADNGDPQFTKWFSWAEKDYSPDLNSWAVLTALQNVVYSLEDAGQESGMIEALKRLLYTAETSCYWYWTGQDVWDAQVTNAANKAIDMAQGAIDNLLRSNRDKTGPTIFVPWVRPANPGGKDWGQGGLADATREATFRTLVHDISGIKKVTLHYHDGKSGSKKQIEMQNNGPYPSRINPSIIATQYQAILPAGTGNIQYFVEASDTRGNVAYSPVGRIHIA